ncbi:MAG: hypothetical protein F6J98_32655 [Moorea sp. SIO4G2]|nr:hypothetical protein [Moorena sp. SIO4G2]
MIDDQIVKLSLFAHPTPLEQREQGIGNSGSGNREQNYFNSYTDCYISDQLSAISDQL